MTKKTQDSDAFTIAKEALTKTDKEKYPKLYESREATVKALEVAQNQKVRAEKAEKKSKSTQEKKPLKNKEDETSKNNYSLQDIRALNDVNDEDVDSIEKFAKMENISIPEAKKHSDMQAILKSREEKRATAAATNTEGGRHGTAKVSGKALLKEFDKSGKVPDNDNELDAMLEAEFKAKSNN